MKEEGNTAPPPGATKESNKHETTNTKQQHVLAFLLLALVLRLVFQKMIALSFVLVFGGKH